MPKPMIILIIVLVLLAAGMVWYVHGYGKPITYTKDVPIHYPDFDLTYRGYTSEELPRVTCYDFDLTRGEARSSISSCSTGLIAAEAFEFQGKKFYITVAGPKVTIDKGLTMYFKFSVEYLRSLY